MPISPYVRRLRQSIGHDLLLLPSVSVLPRDARGRLLLVRQSGDGRWGTIGGAIEVDEAPEDAAVRETEEEAGVQVQITRLLTVLGGPGFRLTYPNGDQAAYVSAVYEARVVGGTPRPDHDETLEVAWFDPADLGSADLGDYARSTFRALGLL